MTACLLLGACSPAEDMTMEKRIGADQWNTLTPEETRVIVQKGTERPFTGEYERHTAEGVYTCRRCGVALYRSTDKFDSGCGWPSFDAEIAGAVKRQRDADGQRVEILCAACGGHLGHVFSGEQLTDKDVRHCVNSVSMAFVASTNAASCFERGVFAGGCFWGVEYYLNAVPGVISTRVGYTGGSVESPTYQQVCETSTGHAEAVEVWFDPKRTDYETVAKAFFEIHDPTHVGRQGPDVGAQYRSVVYTVDEAQRAIVESLIRRLEEKGFKVATKVEPASVFWPAEAYHQDYYAKTGKQPYCHRPVKRFD